MEAAAAEVSKQDEINEDGMTRVEIEEWAKKLVADDKINTKGIFSGRTPILEAASENYHIKVSVLLKHGADPDIPNKANKTPLLIAASKGYYKCVKLFIDAGAKLNITDNYSNVTALDCAQNDPFNNYVRRKEKDECVKLLKAAGARTFRDLWSDREIVLEAMKTDGLTLDYASDDLKNDREVVLEAVKKYGCALEYASNELKNDREVVLEAVKKDKYALKYASDELKNDREIVSTVVKKDGQLLEYASDEVKNDHEVVLEAVKDDGCALYYASDELKNDREVVLEAVKNYGRALEYASDELKNNREVVLEAVYNTKHALSYASHQLHNGGFKTYITERLERYSLKLEVFQSTFLFGLTIKTASIYKLNKLGKYGLLEVKKLIGEYAGLQYGEYPGKLLEVASNQGVVIE